MKIFFVRLTDLVMDRSLKQENVSSFIFKSLSRALSLRLLSLGLSLETGSGQAGPYTVFVRTDLLFSSRLVSVPRSNIHQLVVSCPCALTLPEDSWAAGSFL